MAIERGRLSRRSALRQGLHALSVRPRLIAATAAGVLVGLLLPSGFTGQGRLLIGWDVGVALYLVTTWHMMIRSDVHQLRQRAARHDEGEWAIILLSVAATLSSLVAIGAELMQAGAGDPFRLWRAGIAALTILMSWLFVHTIMALHYAHDYYLREGPGLIFPDRIEAPDYWDFAYFAFTIGVAAQTADVAIASPRIRRVALAHSVLAFVFNTAILALAINVGASLL
ncbi:DUF1345 domain-containing protein [Pleomorphomonas diazotrophica]|uniref:DUF1345 domain-containing protein n=1 Tax=Pleomorphomonas diazotrophica TaxID=1166257 RepID=A0A1I4W0H5_9HYPH|nr:DUF1345 domain-containing protein [Pleomorphomonas diazotrophica]PKR88252.1 DUF1345 domain-containing protein [Pleomorphomonas diazotrophica]SFN06756.1 Uncharacterized membrane protein [Pleomorphomonas diazotrophica]